jgi:hypothetical protein
MNGQPSPNQGGIAQLAGGMGGMGGSPTLGGAPQTPPMPQGGAQKPPQQAPQGQLDPKLLDALSKIAALKVREEESKARARILASMNQGNEGTVVEQLDKQNMEATKKELVDKLSGGLKQAGQMSAQAQGQPMSGGIAAAPGANQAAQPEAMAAGGIVAFDEGGKAESQFKLDRLAKEEDAAAINKRNQDLIELRQAMQRQGIGYFESATPEQRALSESKVAALKNAYEYLKGYDPKTAVKPAAINQERPPPPTIGQNAADYEDMRGPQGGIVTALPRPPAQRPTAAATLQPDFKIQTGNYSPAAAAGAGPTQPGIQSVLSNAMNINPDAAEERGRESFANYNRQDPELVKQLAADNARVRATAERKGAAPTWQESLYAAMPKGRPQPGSSIFTTIGDAVGGINALELQRKNEKETAEKELLGMSKTALETSDKRKMDVFAAGERKAAQAVDILKSALPAGANIESSQIQAASQRATNLSNQKIHELDNIAKRQIAGLANKPTGLERIIERTSKESGIPYHVVAAAFVRGDKGAGPTAAGVAAAKYVDEVFSNPNPKDPRIISALKNAGAPDNLIADIQNKNIALDSPKVTPFLDRARQQYRDKIIADATPPARFGGATSYQQYPVD